MDSSSRNVELSSAGENMINETQRLIPTLIDPRQFSHFGFLEFTLTEKLINKDLNGFKLNGF